MALRQVPPRVATAALLALVVLDIALVGTALRSTRSADIYTSPVSPASAPGGSAESPGGLPSTGSVTAAKAPLQTMIIALDNQRAWRVVAGSCSDGGAALATTADGGKTWAKGSATLRRIVRLRPSDNRTAFVIGANSTCAAELKDTVDGGGTWTSAGTAGTWFRDPKQPTVVRAPWAAATQPCGKGAVLDLAVLATASARVLCVDGLVRSTANNGVLWTDVARVDGAVALAVPAVRSAESYVARLGAPDCAGVQILRVQPRVATSCVETSIPEVPGQIAMSLTEGGGWLAVGTTTMRSTDDLVTWAVS
jgi:hypothetical protein